MASPPAQARCVVPNVQGKTVTQARAALRSKHCRLGAIKTVFNSKVKKGRVVSQSRVPRSRLPVNSVVGVKLSKGPRRR